jgi:hypothetical protein
LHLPVIAEGRIEWTPVGLGKGMPVREDSCFTAEHDGLTLVQSTTRMGQDRVVLRTFTNRDAADMAASQLRAHRIECWLESDDAGGMYPSLLPVKLMVASDQTEEARQVLLHGILRQEHHDLNGDGQFDISIRYNSFQKAIATNDLRKAPTTNAANP